MEHTSFIAAIAMKLAGCGLMFGLAAIVVAVHLPHP